MAAAYNAEAVEQAIRSSRKPIGRGEAKAIHALLRGRSPLGPSAEAERSRQELELRARAPLQSKGKPIEDAAHLPLFIASNEPELF